MPDDAPRVLADACAIIAYFSGQYKIGRAGANAMQGPVAVSSVTVWELTLKASQGRLRGLPSHNGSFIGWLVEQRFLQQPLTWSDGERANALPHLHKDPMDRMLIAQALNAGLTIITEDRIFPEYGVSVIW